MSVTIRKVESEKDLRAFIEFPNSLYKNTPQYIPALYMDEHATLDKNKNASFDFCEADYFLAYKDGELVGRVAAIINPRANATWNKKEVRFGWIDFIDDEEVSSALLQTVIDWGHERGAEEIAGPLGFTDFDPEGMLVEGFDRKGTLVAIYNHPYYMKHLEKAGYTKVVDWVEYLIKVPDELPERLTRIASIILEKNKLHVKKLTRKIIHDEGYGRKFFNLINETYCVLYGYSHLSDRQIDQYVAQYLTFINLDMVCFIENEEGELVAAGVTMPSIADALKKCGGKLFPTGWFHLLRALGGASDTLEMLLVAVKPEYQNKGVNAILFADLFPSMKRLGYKYAESNPELETNDKVQSQWTGFDFEQHKRRRIYGKKI